MGQDFLFEVKNATWATTLSLKSIAIIVMTAITLGAIISLVYILTHKKEGYSQPFCVALIILAPIVGLVIHVIGTNTAAAFSLAGAFALIRFRSAPGDPKDIAFLFMSVAMGLTCGLGYWPYAIAATAIILCAVLILHFTNFAGKRHETYQLKITVPETLNYVGAFDETLSKYCATYKMIRVKSVDFGALFEISFNVTLKDEKQMREMLDDLRALNGNLKLVIAAEATAKSFHFQ